MDDSPKKLGQYLPEAIIVASTTLVVLVIAKPFGMIFDAWLRAIAIHEEKLLLLQIMVALLIVLLGMLSYILLLHKKFHYKRVFRFGVYWYKLKPYCPCCGNKLEENIDYQYLFDCQYCKERIYLFNDKTKDYIKSKDAVEIIHKET